MQVGGRSTAPLMRQRRSGEPLGRRRTRRPRERPEACGHSRSRRTRRPACSVTFWLVENLTLIGRHDEARALFERLLALRNDVGLLPEEYDVEAERFVGNFPQALTHTSLVHAAATLAARPKGLSAESLR